MCIRDRSNPNSRFSASVNLGSSKYYRNSVNQINSGAFLNNTLSSSVSYSKTFQTVPEANISVTLTHSQNNKTEWKTMTFPTFQGNLGRIYPFASKTGSKNVIIQNINLQYSVLGENKMCIRDRKYI